MTDPTHLDYLLDQFPGDPLSLCQNIHKITLIDFFANMGIIDLPSDCCREVNIRSIKDKLQTLIEMDGRLFTEERSLTKRLPCNCHDLSLMICAIFRNNIAEITRSGDAAFTEIRALYEKTKNLHFPST